MPQVSHLSTCYLQNPSLAMAFGSRLLSSQQFLLSTDSYKATDAGSFETEACCENKQSKLKFTVGWTRKRKHADEEEKNTSQLLTITNSF